MGLCRFLLSRYRVLPGLLLLMVFVPDEAAWARTWNVFVDGSGDASTIQGAINIAAADDTVLVHPGTYFEIIRFRGRDIVLKSAAGPAQTLIDGLGVGARMVTIDKNESRAALLQGFTITHGLGGIMVLDAQPSIIGNIITENDAGSEDGGGIWCTAGTFYPWFPLIQGNVITNNRGRNLGGGIGFGQRMVPEILGNRVEGNEAQDGDGGGIYYRSFDNGAVIRGNTVVNNRAGDHGGGIYVGHVGDGVLEAEVSWNSVANNYARGSEITGNSGGGIWLWETNAWVHHNTIVGNTGNGPNNAYGGGIVAEQPGSPTIEQNIIAFSTNGGGIWCGNGATPIIRNNLAWQNVGGNGVKDCPTWWQSNGNVIDNPYFCDMASGDYHVAWNSGVMTHPAGPLGAFPDPGCGPVAVHPSTWGAIKAKYSSSH